MHFSPSRAIAPTAIFVVLFAACFAAPSVPAQANSQALNSILSQMDAASAKFTSAQADLRQELYTKVVNETETQTGEIYFLRKGGATQMGMKLMPPDAAPTAQPAKVLEFSAGKLQVLTPEIDQIDVFSAGKNQQLADTLLTLGFGGRGSELQKSWIVTDQGPETIAGTKADKLDLVPRDQTIKNNFSHIVIWIDPVRDVSLKQVFFEASGGQPTGDTRTVYFTNIRLNQPVNTTPFALKCKGKCTIVNH